MTNTSQHSPGCPTLFKMPNTGRHCPICPTLANTVQCDGHWPTLSKMPNTSQHKSWCPTLANTDHNVQTNQHWSWCPTLTNTIAMQPTHQLPTTLLHHPSKCTSLHTQHIKLWASVIQLAEKWVWQGPAYCNFSCLPRVHVIVYSYCTFKDTA